MTITPERQARVAFTRPYNEVDELVVVHADRDSIISLGDLAGRTVHVRASSSFYSTLTALQDSIEGPRNRAGSRRYRNRRYFGRGGRWHV